VSVVVLLPRVSDWRAAWEPTKMAPPRPAATEMGASKASANMASADVSAAKVASTVAAAALCLGKSGNHKNCCPTYEQPAGEQECFLKHRCTSFSFKSLTSLCFSIFASTMPRDTR